MIFNADELLVASSSARPAAIGNAGCAHGAARKSLKDESMDNEERDEYDDLLALLGRTYDQDCRVAIHESGHAVCARLLGHTVGGVTVDPDPVRGSQGLCWGIGHSEAFAAGRGDASGVREALAPMMPKAGEDSRSVSDVFASVYAHAIELMAGRAAERILLDGEPVPPVDDLRQARELALLICKSEDAIGTFIAHCEIAARDLLIPHADILMVASIVLRIKRTLDGAEIDKIIRDVVARNALENEHLRRKQWQATIERARVFTSV